MKAFGDCSIRGSIKRSPIVENSLCPFSQMQHWSVYLTMSHEYNWHPSEWTILVCFDGETAEWSSGKEVGPVLPDEWWALFNICQGLLQNKGLRSAWCFQQCYQAFSTGLKKCRNCDTSEIFWVTYDTLS